jgi:hypothetical protein
MNQPTSIGTHIRIFLVCAVDVGIDLTRRRRIIGCSGGMKLITDSEDGDQ